MPGLKTKINSRIPLWYNMATGSLDGCCSSRKQQGANNSHPGTSW